MVLFKKFVNAFVFSNAPENSKHIPKHLFSNTMLQKSNAIWEDNICLGSTGSSAVTK